MLTQGLAPRLGGRVIERHLRYQWLPKQQGEIVCLARNWVVVQWADGKRERFERDEISHEESALIELMPNE